MKRSEILPAGANEIWRLTARHRDEHQDERTHLPYRKWLKAMGLMPNEYNRHRWTNACIRGGIDTGEFEWVSERKGTFVIKQPVFSFSDDDTDWAYGQWLADRKLVRSEETHLAFVKETIDELVEAGFLKRAKHGKYALTKMASMRFLRQPGSD